MSEVKRRPGRPRKIPLPPIGAPPVYAPDPPKKKNPYVIIPKDKIDDDYRVYKYGKKVMIKQKTGKGYRGRNSKYTESVFLLIKLLKLGKISEDKASEIIKQLEIDDSNK